MDRRTFLTAAAAGAAALSLRPSVRGDGTGSPAYALYAWSGAVTPTSARVTVAFPEPAGEARLEYAADPSFAGGVKTDGQPAPDGLVTFDLGDLKPGTTYHYRVWVRGRDRPLDLTGHFATFPERPAEFTVCFASCAATGSTSPVFTAIRKQAPAIFLHLGDLHYMNIGQANPEWRRSAYEAVHSSVTQGDLYRSVPVAYVWDDHDFLGNNSDGDVAGRPAKAAARADARVVYRQCVPHYPLPAGDGDQAIYQAFSLGRVRFVLTDTRSEKRPRDKTMLGRAQKAWFFAEVKRAAETHRLIAWCSSVPWIGGPKTANPDLWAGFPEERAEIADFFKKEGLAGRVCLLSGDAHMLAIDDGSHADYASGGGMPIPVFHAASLDQRASEKGGPYSHGMRKGRGQFGRMRVRDDGTKLRVEWAGLNANGEVVAGMEHTFTV